ncbi:type 1 glutamine amidotransferase domain-containing protein [Pseudoduganella ginsengisoli]|uniref:Type 1 glutamine amidotransferase domain-containing protein n=1 Tax=Pseudoduganella ginsengisoli TaxID=1462440 RepID=A0A6L6Q6T7_9BURK|nr:type 1 glutamine amidotransferase domain-containing protein [Pseudoduganella ginsengisoli]MTW05226.1 type 1 glutamine amidotransferase domain-containing protein [Pseudoduganella ginsengisoli]
MKQVMKQAAMVAALGLAAAGAQAANVLVLLSDEAVLDLKGGKQFATGFYANELMQPVKKFIDAGHTVTFATPLGKVPALDKLSVDKMHFGNDEAAMQVHLALMERLKITSAEASPVISLARVAQQGYAKYDAVFVPGGHAPMQDLVRSPQVGQLLAHFHAAGKPTALVCHGPAALVAAMNQPGKFVAALEAGAPAKAERWAYAGYKMTVLNNAEEEMAKGMLGGEMKVTPQAALQTAGAVYSSGAPWAAYVVTDRELITGQNPASALGVADALLAKLK